MINNLPSTLFCCPASGQSLTLLKSILLISLISALRLLEGSALDKSPVDFQRQVRPILSNNCFQCHGPDPKARMADLRLDIAHGVFSRRQAGAVVVPGDVEKSLIYQRITNHDKASRMPPEYIDKELSEEEIGVIRSWIEEGAPWKEHWSFTPLNRPQLPPVQHEEWVLNPIDRFVLARLEQAGLKPAPEADRRTLARRVSLDLTGLPPSPTEVMDFVQDTSAEAYSKFVERLMRSQAYGEHRARYWLDAARYGDTHGLHIDNYREIWPYRDWVIRAFNRNLPFDQFTVEQLAGDLLPVPTPEQIIATGFHRCNITTNEGGVIAEEVAVMYAKDRVDTTGTVWLGLTVGCATCHDHKFDPISQEDFYSLSAFFRNTTQKPLDGNEFDTPPVVVVPGRGDEKRWNQLRKEVPVARKNLERIRLAAHDEFNQWLKGANRQSLLLDPFDLSQILSLELKDDPHVLVGLSGVKTKLGTETLVDQTGPLPFLSFPEETFSEIEEFPSLSADLPFTVSVTFRFNGEKSQFVLASQIDPNNDGRGWTLEISKGQPVLRLTVMDGRFMGIIRVSTESRLVPDQWYNIIVAYDGMRQRTGFSLYLDGEVVPTKTVGRAIRVLEGSIQNRKPLIIGARDTEGEEKTGFLDGAIRQFRILNRTISEAEAPLLARWDLLPVSLMQSESDLNQEEKKALQSYFLLHHHSEFKQAALRLKNLQDQRRVVLRRSSLTHVMQDEEGRDPMAHVLRRGMYDQQLEEVLPATPNILPPMAADLPRNRLGLARWLVDDANPLTSRVTVNRFWQQVFGTGLTSTAEDFGSQGEAPSHPQLLDWLAVEFRESAWDMKHIFRLMLTSATYRQQARTNQLKIKKDPNNRLVSRGPRFRMDGEMVRDHALAASGLLSRRVGGSSVKPYQPSGVWEAVAMDGSNTRFYQQGSGTDLYRRSLYTFWKRAAPPPGLLLFNAPTREECTVRRERTNTPLQALLTLNGTQFFEAARHLAQRSMHSSHVLEERLNFMTFHLLSRFLQKDEREVVRGAYEDYLQFYVTHDEEAKKALSVGDSKPDGALPQAEFAAWTMVANQLMNLDEVLNK